MSADDIADAANVSVRTTFLYPVTEEDAVVAVVSSAVGSPGPGRASVGAARRLAPASAGSIVPLHDVREVQLLLGVDARGVWLLRDLVDLLTGVPYDDSPPELPSCCAPGLALGMVDVAGQTVGRTAIEATAAGGHHALLLAPPGIAGPGAASLAHRGVLFLDDIALPGKRSDATSSRRRDRSISSRPVTAWAAAPTCTSLTAL